MDAYGGTLPLVRRDGRTFEVEAVRLAAPGGDGPWVPRVFEGGLLVNRDDMPRLGSHDAAMTHGINFARTYERKQARVGA